MEKQPRNLGRAYLVAQLQRRGVSRRFAVRILNFVFGEMKKALKRGKEVEFPFGKLKRVRYDSIRYLELIEDWSASHEGYTVIHESDEVGEHLLNGLRQPELARRSGGETGK
jgi:hypothetical protein